MPLAAETAPVRLFDPITLRGTEFRNRLWVSPMCMYAVDAEDGVPGRWHLGHYPTMARGGAGLVVIEATGVVPEGRISPRCLGLWNDEQQSVFAEIARRVHEEGGKLAVQLAHAGRKASTEPWLPGFTGATVPESEGGWPTVAPSAIAFGDLAAPRALDTDEVTGLVEAFAAAADRAVAAGLDAVELHAAHGYLFHEFLSPLSNQRDDHYGGPLEARARFLLDTVRAIRAKHSELPILVRISATEWTEGGFDVAEATRVAAWLREAGADLIDVSSGGNTPSAPIPVGPAYQAPLAGEVRTAGLPVSTVGQITEAGVAQSVLTLGQADVVSVGREWLRQPYLALAWAVELRGDLEAIRPPQLSRAYLSAKRSK